MMLFKKSQGQLVKKLQAKLLELGYNPGPADGIFGAKTEQAVISFQSDRDLDIDGVVGDQTWNELFKEKIPMFINSLNSTPKYEHCVDIFGDPFVSGWDNQNMAKCDLSNFRSELEHVYWGWLTEKDKSFIHHNWFGFLCHKLVVPKYQEAFKNVIDRGLAKQIKTFDGCLNKRKMRGGNNYSTHSWGIAIDLNAKWNRMGHKNFGMNEDLAKCFEDAGFVWGGRWTGYPDAMHFQFCTVR